MKKRNIIGITLLGMAAVGLIAWAAPISMPPAQESKATSARIYELRTYHTNPGKLDALHARFRDHTNHLFVKQGMTLVGYWTLAEGDESDSTLVYLIAHESRDAARKSWSAFGSDPDWRKVYAESRADGPLVAKLDSQFLDPTDYSPLR